MGVNSTITYTRDMARGVPFLEHFKEVLNKMFGLLIISTVYNVFLAFYSPNTYSIYSYFFRWEILQTIAFSTIFIVPFLRTKKITRIVIAALIYLFQYQLFKFVNSNSDPIRVL